MSDTDRQECCEKGPAGEATFVSFYWPGARQSLKVTVGTMHQLPPGEYTTAGERTKISSHLDAWLAFLWPNAEFSRNRWRPTRLPFRTNIRPVASQVAGNVDPNPHLVPRRERLESPLVVRLSRRNLDVPSALAVLAAQAPSELVIKLFPHALDARAHRILQSFGMAAGFGQGIFKNDTFEGELLESFVSDLGQFGRGIRIEVETGFSAEPCQSTLDLVSLSLFGEAADRLAPSDDLLDLRTSWPLGWAIPRLLPARPEVKMIEARTTAANRKLARNCVVLGKSDSGESLWLSERDRARHLYVLGGTGTGKSTLLLNLIQQDMDAGRGIILIDPHGDLADAARQLVPQRRRSELIWSDLADNGSISGINILEGQGGSPELEQNYVCNQLIRLFTRVLYRDVPEAFGPIFETYFRNGLMLLMGGGNSDSTLMDFERVFHDEQFRKELLDRCPDEKVKEFWRNVAARVSWEELRLENVAPYIVSKLAQLTGNPLVRRMINAPRSALDFRAVMDCGGIALIKLAKGLIGNYDATPGQRFKRQLSLIPIKRFRVYLRRQRDYRTGSRYYPFCSSFDTQR